MFKCLKNYNAISCDVTVTPAYWSLAYSPIMYRKQEIDFWMCNGYLMDYWFWSEASGQLGQLCEKAGTTSYLPTFNYWQSSSLVHNIYNWCRQN